MPCTLRRSSVARAHHDGRLGPGRTAALDEDRLVLLPSGPDTVRGSPLRGTRSSTSHRRAATEDVDLERGFSPAGADCRLQGTASSPPSTAREGYRGQPAMCGCTTGVGGEGGIRTRDGLPQTAFPVRRHSPLGDLSPRSEGNGMPPRLQRDLWATRQPAGSGRRGEGGAQDRSERTTPGGPSRRSASHRPDGSYVSEDRRRQRTRRGPGLRAGWRRGRDSNPRCFRTPLFESGTINHSDTSPSRRIPKGAGTARSRAAQLGQRVPLGVAPTRRTLSGGLPI